jgi:type III secretion protein L
MDAAHLLKPGRLIALGTALRPDAHRIPAGEAETLARAGEILAEAERQAAEIAEEAKRGYERECRRGFETGRAEGQAAVLKRVLEEQAVLDRNLADLEQDIAELAISVARAVIGKAAEGEVALALAQRALREMRREKRAELRVAPPLVAEVRARIESILGEFPEIELVNVVEDSSLEAGKVVLESKLGRVDADVEMLLAEFDAHLARILRQRAALRDSSGG